MADRRANIHTDRPRWVCGLDLSGPANHVDTALTWFDAKPDGLHYAGCLCPASDRDIVEQLRTLAGKRQVVLGIDAPLSYNDGGGQRTCDASLKCALKHKGVGFVGVMPPTLDRMVYLTLRGISLTRAIMSLDGARNMTVVEVHPGAALALRGAPELPLRKYKSDDHEALGQLKQWLAKQGLRGLPRRFGKTSHEIDSAAGALAAWKWSIGDCVWLARAEPPQRPYDFAC